MSSQFWYGLNAASRRTCCTLRTIAFWKRRLDVKDTVLVITTLIIAVREAPSTIPVTLPKDIAQLPATK